jgi:uncharacterized protein YoxC
MEHTTPNKDEIKLLIDNALLQNNEKINKAIDESATKVTQAVTLTTQTFLTELTTIATKQGAMQGEIDSLKSKLGNLWAKMIGVGAACTTLGGLVGFFIEALSRNQ